MSYAGPVRASTYSQASKRVHPAAHTSEIISRNPAAESSREITTSADKFSVQQKTETKALAHRTDEFLKKVESDTTHSDVGNGPRKRRCLQATRSMSPLPVQPQSRTLEDHRASFVPQSPMGSRSASDFVVNLRRAQMLARQHQQEADNRAEIDKDHAEWRSQGGRPAVKVSQAESLQEEQRNERKDAADEDEDSDAGEYVMVDADDAEWLVVGGPRR